MHHTFMMEYTAKFMFITGISKEPLIKYHRMHPVGGLGVSPSFNVPQDWGIQGVEQSFPKIHLKLVAVQSQASRDPLRYDRILSE